MSNRNLIVFFGCLFVLNVRSQSCTFTLNGYIKDLETDFAIANANLHIEGVEKNIVSDSLGHFVVTDLCRTDYHLTISHIGCETQKLYINLQRDTTIYVYIDHFSHALHSVTVEGNKKPTTQMVQSLSEKNINENLNLNLGNMLEAIVGVRTIRNGSGIAKPVVSGLYGSRLLIVNNNIPQSGQQWGNDHSPEIDPFVANKILVVKGASTIEYQGSNLGSVILIEPNKISNEPHLHGKAAYYYETNGRGHGINAQVNRAYQAWAWRLSTTYKKSGDKHSPDYYLTNTGNSEKNIALQLEKQHSTNWHSDLYFSSFNTEIGILRGSHISNLTDLQNALKSDVPLFTRDTFAYSIQAPRQRVNHHLLKLHSKYFFTDHQWLDITFGSQYNTRNEYDVRRGGRSSIPALSIQQYTQYIETKYALQFNDYTTLKLGVQSTITNNINNPETGILPLIPDYNAYDGGVYALLTKKVNKWEWEAGLRYDLKYQKVAVIENSLPRKVVRYNNVFHNKSAIFGAAFTASESTKLKANIGVIDRSPAINELYSMGLHQGVSGIEEGDKTLKQEQAIKGTLAVESRVSDKFFIELLAYYQQIHNYIFLKPQEEIRLTLRGAFPVFKYEKTDANIYGIDVSAIYNISAHVMANVKYSYLRGYNQNDDLGLINLPPSYVSSSIQYSLPKIANIENLEIEASHQYTFTQSYILASQDYVAPPTGYGIFRLKLSIQKQIKEQRWNFHIKIDNVLNEKYRDYLNKQRYFSDDLGSSVVAGIHVSF